MLVLHVLPWSLFLLITFIHAEPVNVTLPITSPAITYIPYLCADASHWSGSSCPGGWRLIPSNTSVVSTSGPSPATGNILPQLYLTIRAQSVFVKLFDRSDAIANMTASTPSGVSVSLLLNSTVAEAGIVSLVHSELVTIVITYLPGSVNASLNIQSIVVTVDDPADVSSYLPSQSLPSPTSPLVYTSRSTNANTPSTIMSTSSSSSRHRSPVNLKLVQAFSLVLGIGLGLSCIMALALIYWRRFHHHKSPEGVPW